MLMKIVNQNVTESNQEKRQLVAGRPLPDERVGIERERWCDKRRDQAKPENCGTLLFWLRLI